MFCEHKNGKIHGISFQLKYLLLIYNVVWLVNMSIKQSRLWERRIFNGYVMMIAQYT